MVEMGLPARNLNATKAGDGCDEGKSSAPNAHLLPGFNEVLLSVAATVFVSQAIFFGKE